MSYARNLARLARTGAPTVDTAQALRDLPIYGGLYPERVETLGALAAGDGGGGTWRWDPDSTADDNTGTVLLPTGHVGAGRWVRDYPESINVRWWGCGTPDDASAFQAAIDYAQATGVHATLYIPHGRYNIGCQLRITHRLWVCGDGTRNTLLEPTNTLSTHMFLLDDVWRDQSADGGEGPSQVLDHEVIKSTVRLADFSIIGNRETNNASVGGIATYNRVDHLSLSRIDINSLRGEGLVLGRDGEKGITRESLFDRVLVRRCGTDGAYDPVVITTSATAGDGTNQLYFHACSFVENYGRVLISGDSPTHDTRRLRFVNLMAHGRNKFDDAPAADVILINGAVQDVVFTACQFNGSTDVGGNKYAVMRFGETATGAPSYIVVEADVRSCQGHGYVVEKTGGLLMIRGTVQNVSVAGNEARFEQDCVSAPSVQYQVMGFESGRTIFVDPTVAGMVAAMIVATDDAPLLVRPGLFKVYTAGESTLPSIYAGDGSPEGVVAADPGSLYLGKSQDNRANGQSLWTKALGSGTTGWIPLQPVAVVTSSRLLDAADPVNLALRGQMVYDGDLAKPLWKSAVGVTGGWRDATGTSVHVPS